MKKMVVVMLLAAGFTDSTFSIDGQKRERTTIPFEEIAELFVPLLKDKIRREILRLIDIEELNAEAQALFVDVRDRYQEMEFKELMGAYLNLAIAELTDAAVRTAKRKAVLKALIDEIKMDFNRGSGKKKLSSF